MRFITSFVTLFLIYLMWGCTNIDDATLSNRNSFIHVFEGPLNYTSTDVIEVRGGYVLLGNMTITDDSVVTVVIKTDRYGNPQGVHNYYPGGSGKSIKPFSNADFSGYLIIGDRIKINPLASEVGNIEIASTRLLAIDDELTGDTLRMEGSATIKDTTNNLVKTDYKGSSMTVTNDGRVVILSTYRKTIGNVQDPEKPLLYVLKNNFSFDTSDPYKHIRMTDVDWTNPYDVVDKDYINGKSIHHFNNDRIIWASSILKQQSNFTDSYVSVPYLEEPLSYINSDRIGDNIPSQKQFTVVDIQPAKDVAFGFGIIGTFAETDGTKKNLFFTTVKYNGAISHDTLFFDASLGKTVSTRSDIDDTGESICSTSDGGYVLAGTLSTASVNGETIGNGFRDILLIKVNAEGEIEWTKTVGGVGDEVVSRIRETKDRGLLISGTNTIGGYSSIFLIKTDKNGELKN